jgi:hypothetical protein
MSATAMMVFICSRLSQKNRHPDTDVRWGIYENGYYYERVLTKIWTNILTEASPGSRVLDVGYVALLCYATVLYRVRVDFFLHH